VKIDNFASRTDEIQAPTGGWTRTGVIDGLLKELGSIEAIAAHLHGEAVAGRERAKAVIAETEREPPAETPPKRQRRPWWRRLAG